MPKFTLHSICINTKKVYILNFVFLKKFTVYPFSHGIFSGVAVFSHIDGYIFSQQMKIVYACISINIGNIRYS